MMLFKIFMSVVFCFISLMTFASEKVDLQTASFYSGVLAGSQQRPIKQGIDLAFFKQGFIEGIDKPLSIEELPALYSRVKVFPDQQNKKQLKKINPDLINTASIELGQLLAKDAIELLKQIDVDEYMKGFKKGYQKNISSPKLAQYSIALTQYHEQERLKNAGAQLQKSRLFLSENAKRKGVITTASGLQYEILQEGKGEKPRIVDSVKVNYRHSKPESDIYYDSAEKGHSETMSMRGVIPKGWRELFLLMQPGAKYRVYLSPELGWGTEGNGDFLMPNEVLITEFTLLEIIPPTPVVHDPWQ
jgi:FKBP-type peptidyl-prolyl cis-trans isomerase FklB